MVGLLMIAPRLSAAGAPPGSQYPVIYNPDTLQSAQGDAPFTFQYDLRVTSPASLPVGPTTTVTMNLGVTNSPAGSDPTTALTFVTFSQSTLQFTGPGQTQAVTVFLNIPAGSSDGDFTYLIKTLGWPAGYNIVDNGTRINAHVNPPSALLPPTVSIDSPLNGTIYTHTIGAPAIQVPITASGVATDSAVVSALTATITGYGTDGSLILPTQNLNLTLTGLGTAHTSGMVSNGFPVSVPGVYTLVATAVNSQGSATTTTTFIVQDVLNVIPPTVVITSPGLNATFPLSVASTGVRMDFTGASQTYGAVITQLTHQLDNGPVVSVPSATLNQATAYGTITLPVTTTGPHTFTVTATDAYGTATATSSFIVVDDTPVISTLSGIVFADTNLDGVRQSGESGLGSVVVALKSSSGAMLATTLTAADGSYSFSVTSGTYIVSVGAVSGSVLTTANNHVVAVGSAAVTAPDTGYGANIQHSPTTLSGVVFYDANGNGSRDLPADYGLAGVAVQLLSSTGTVISTVSTLGDGSYSFGVLPGTYAVNVAGVSGLIKTTTSPLPYTIVVGDTAALAPQTGYGPQALSTLSGTVFFDVNFNGVRNTGDYGLAGFGVALKNAAGTSVIISTTSNSSGNYTFANLAPGKYLIVVTGIAGLTPTTLNEWPVTVSGSSLTAPDTGYGLNFAAIRTMASPALSQGYWKNNVSKNLAGKTSGVQVCLADLNRYTTTIASLGLPPFNGLTLSAANTIFAGKNQLQLQLLAAEYNYASGAYIGGSGTLTYAFVYWGETVMQNTGGVYSASYQTFTASWMAAYDTSEGGLVLGPQP